MKTNINDFRKLSDPDLIIKIKDLRGQLFVLNFQIASGKSNSFSDVKKLKQQIAWILTIIQERKDNKKQKSKKINI